MPGVDRHSRLVGWLKVGLPLVALAILSLLFLVADRIDPSAAIPYAQVDVEALARDPRMTAPSYAGLTDDGTAIDMTAHAARPAGETGIASAEEVTARLAMPDGGSAEITAAHGEIDDAKGELRLSGGVTYAASTGYRLRTPGLIAALDRTGARSTGPVSATGPAGQIAAQDFVLTRDSDAGDTEGETGKAGGTPYLLVFSGDVRVTYLPDGPADRNPPDPNPTSQNPTSQNPTRPDGSPE